MEIMKGEKDIVMEGLKEEMTRVTDGMDERGVAHATRVADEARMVHKRNIEGLSDVFLTTRKVRREDDSEDVVTLHLTPKGRVQELDEKTKRKGVGMIPMRNTARRNSWRISRRCCRRTIRYD